MEARDELAHLIAARRRRVKKAAEARMASAAAAGAVVTDIEEQALTLPAPSNGDNEPQSKAVPVGDIL